MNIHIKAEHLCVCVWLWVYMIIRSVNNQWMVHELWRLFSLLFSPMESFHFILYTSIYYHLHRIENVFSKARNYLTFFFCLNKQLRWCLNTSTSTLIQPYFIFVEISFRACLTFYVLNLYIQIRIYNNEFSLEKEKETFTCTGETKKT